MSGPFRSIDVAGSGLGAHAAWLDAIAHNVANVNTRAAEGEEPFRATRPVFAERDGGEGVSVAGARRADGDPALVLDGGDTVALPRVDLGAELTDMIVANRGYQANLRVVQTARERYEAAMRLGRA